MNTAQNLWTESPADKKKKKKISLELITTVINFISGYLFKKVSDKIALRLLLSLHRFLIKEENK